MTIIQITRTTAMKKVVPPPTTMMRKLPVNTHLREVILLLLQSTLEEQLIPLKFSRKAIKMKKVQLLQMHHHQTTQILLTPKLR